MNPVPFDMRDPLIDPYHAEGALEPGEIKARQPHRTRVSRSRRESLLVLNHNFGDFI